MAAIREYDGTDADIEAFVSVHNDVWHEHPLTADDLREEAGRRNPEHVSRRWTAFEGTTPVGCASAGHNVWRYQSHSFRMSVGVITDYANRRIGGDLFVTVREALSAYQPEAIRVTVHEDCPRGVRFAEDRGFVEEMRDWESVLDVATFDPVPWSAAAARPATGGIVIRTLRELASDPDSVRKLWELERVTEADVPSGEPPVMLSLEEYRRLVTDRPRHLPDGFFIAIDAASGQFVGSSGLWRRSADTQLRTGLTGVRREYRRRGIALAMKLHAIEFARSIGAPAIRTENATTNWPMLAINEALGFKRLPASISMILRVADR